VLDGIRRLALANLDEPAWRGSPPTVRLLCPSVGFLNVLA
jgi:hypothetical protein